MFSKKGSGHCRRIAYELDSWRSGPNKTQKAPFPYTYSRVGRIHRDSRCGRGIRREFPSKLKGREAHSVACFLPMREKYEFLLQWKELFKDPSLDADKNYRSKAIQHVVGLHHLDLVDMFHQGVIETMTACLCRVGEAMPTKERMLKISRSDLTFRYDSEGRLLEAKLMLIPLKKAVRDRKFGVKVPIVIPFDAGPFLRATELLWIMVMINPCAKAATLCVSTLCSRGPRTSLRPPR